MACSNDGCENEGQWRPLLHLRSRKNGPITVLRFIQLSFCKEHKESSSIDTVLSDEGFVKIAKGLKENGKVNPIQRWTTLDWEQVVPTLDMTVPLITLPARGPDDDLAF